MRNLLQLGKLFVFFKRMSFFNDHILYTGNLNAEFMLTFMLLPSISDSQMSVSEKSSTFPIFQREISKWKGIINQLTFPMANNPLSKNSMIPKNKNAIPKPANPTPISEKRPILIITKIIHQGLHLVYRQNSIEWSDCV